MSTSYPNIILIAGSGRNSGKTTLGEVIIKQNASHIITSLKVSNHFHGHYETLNLLIKTDGLIIGEEKQSNATRDSNRYLNAGASRSIYVECADDKLPDLLRWINENTEINTPIVCESGGMGKYIIPGLAFFLTGGSKSCSWNFQHIQLDQEQIEVHAASVQWHKNGWR